MKRLLFGLGLAASMVAGLLVPTTQSASAVSTNYRCPGRDVLTAPTSLGNGAILRVTFVTKNGERSRWCAQTIRDGTKFHGNNGATFVNINGSNSRELDDFGHYTHFAGPRWATGKSVWVRGGAGFGKSITERTSIIRLNEWDYSHTRR